MKHSLLRLSLLALLLTLCSPIFAFEVGGIQYALLSDSTVEVCKNGYYTSTYSGSIVIPETVDYEGSMYRVTSIGSKAFYRCENLASITIPQSVTSIDWYAFQDSSLPSIIIPNSVTTIGGFAFGGCRYLSSISIPNSVTFIGQYAFSGCESLTSITIPNSITSISSDTFSYCRNLSSVTIGGSVKTIGVDAFRDCELQILRILSYEPPIIQSSINSASLEVPIGCTMKYATAEKWKNIETIYAVQDSIRYFPVFLVEEGDKIVDCAINEERGIELAEDITINISLVNDYPETCLVIISGKDVTDSIKNVGRLPFKAFPKFKYNYIETHAYPTKIINLTSSGTLLDKIGKEDIDNTYSLKISGDIDGTDILTIRKMKNLKLLDLKNATIVNGGASYYNNYITSENTIGDYFFSKKDNLISVVLPQNIKTIRDYAFYNCEKLKSIILPKSLEKVHGIHVFDYCNSLESVTILCPLEVSQYWFSHMETIKTVIIGDSVPSLDTQAFALCTNLCSVELGKGIKYIGIGAFDYCNNLTSISIPSSVISIGDNAFNCSKLATCIIEDSNEALVLNETVFGKAPIQSVYIGRNISSTNSIFNGFLKSVKFGPKVSAIGDRVFLGCTGLISFDIPNSITTIQYHAFEGCSNLKTITIPNSVTTIDGGAFYDCSGLTSLTIPTSVISIGHSAFFRCIGLSSITIPNSVKYLGGVAFGSCSGLTSVTIGNGISKIESGTFRDCKKLTSIVIPPNVQSIGTYAFQNCELLPTIIIPNSVKTIDYSAFTGCSSLTHIDIPHSVTKLGFRAFENCNSLTSIIIPNSIDIIGSSIFCKCSELRSVIFEDGLRTTGDLTFYCCPKLKSVTIPNTITSIGASCFEGCLSLNSFIIPNSVESIGNNAFARCKSLSSVTIGSGVKATGKDVFIDCDSIKNIEILCESVLSWFSEKPSVEVLTLGDNVKQIGSKAFYRCTGLTSVTIPDNVTIVGGSAFAWCTKMTSVIIGSSVNYIGSYAFYNSNLNSVSSLNRTPPAIDLSTFNDETYKNATLFVPQGSKNLYWLNPNWENFFNIEEIEVSSFTNTILNNKCDDNIYNLNGLKVKGNSLVRGIYIKNGKKVIIK